MQLSRQAYRRQGLRLLAVLFLLSATTVAVQAQRGAGGYAGGSGAVAGVHASAPRPSGAFAGTASYRGGPAAGTNFITTPPGQRQLFLPPGITSTQPIDYGYGGRRVGGNGRLNAGYGARGGYGVLGAYGFGVPYVGYGDFGFAYANSDAYDPLDPNNIPAYPPAAPYPPSAPQAGYGAPGANVAAAPASPVGPYAAPAEESSAPAPVRPVAARVPSAPPAPLADEDAVTIVFKDGRPNESIQNYALTRTTLYVTGKKVRSIPVEEIDLPATEKVNERAGVEFQLPEAK